MKVSFLVDTESVSRVVSIDTKNDLRVTFTNSLVIDTVRSFAEKLSKEGYYSCITGIRKIKYLLDTVCRTQGWEWSFSELVVHI